MTRKNQLTIKTNISFLTKNLVGILALTFLTKVGNSQDLANLDSEYGMKKFKLESSYDNYKSSLELEIDGEVKYFNYVGSDIKSLFDQDVKRVVLGFYKDKLYYIGLKFDESKPIYTDLIYQKLELLFGAARKTTKFETGPLSYDWAYIWQTEKTYLRFDKSRPNEFQSSEVSIWMHSKILERQMVNDDW